MLEHGSDRGSTSWQRLLAEHIVDLGNACESTLVRRCASLYCELRPVLPTATGDTKSVELLGTVYAVVSTSERVNPRNGKYRWISYNGDVR